MKQKTILTHESHHDDIKTRLTREMGHNRHLTTQNKILQNKIKTMSKDESHPTRKKSNKHKLNMLTISKTMHTSKKATNPNKHIHLSTKELADSSNFHTYTSGHTETEKTNPP
jgi:hypothetical protein